MLVEEYSTVICEKLPIRLSMLLTNPLASKAPEEDEAAEVTFVDETFVDVKEEAVVAACVEL